MRPDQQIAWQKRLVSAARAVLALDVGLVVGAHRVQNVLQLLGSDAEAKYPVFGSFIEAVPLDVPYGQPRLHWEAAALLAQDARLEAVERQFRRQILEACIAIINNEAS